MLDYFRENFRYDPETGHIWRICGMVNAQKYRRVEVSLGTRGSRVRCNVAAHRLAWFLMTEEWPPDDLMIDHKNRVPQDNRWENLRICNAKENARNRKGWGKIESRGVSYMPGREKPYRTSIGTWPDSRVIGFYATEEEAAEAYKAAARQRYGEFAAE